MTLLALSLGYFMVILDTTVVNVALPRLGRSLHAAVAAAAAFLLGVPVAYVPYCSRT